MTLNHGKAHRLAAAWLNEHLFGEKYEDDFVDAHAESLVSVISKAVFEVTAHEPKPGVTWIAILTFSRAKGAELFCERFKDHLDLGTTDKVVIFSNVGPDSILHVVGEAMDKYSLMTFTVNKIRTPVHEEKSDGPE